MTVIDLPDLDALDNTDTHPAATPEQNELLTWAKQHDTRRPGPPVRNGRYRAPQPGDTKQRSWTRVSTIAALLDDPKSLEKWRRRILMRGLHSGDTLTNLAAQAVRDGDDTELNRIAELALGRGGVTVAADLGTAIHLACEHIDENREEALTGFPDRYRPDLDAYRTLLDRYGLEPVAVETPCFTPLDPNDPTEAAVGRIDRIYRTRRGKLIVGDIKTGSSVEWLNNAIQAAIYTRATHHWGPDGWTEAPPVEQDAAFIVHLPLGEGTAELIRIDTASAWERIDAALAVRRARRGVNLLFAPAPPPPPETPAEEPATETPATKPNGTATGEQKVASVPFPTEVPTDRDEWITGRIKTLTASTAARQLLQEQWPDGTPRRPPWTPAQHDLIVPVLDDIETRVRAPFPHNDPEAPEKQLSGQAKALLDPEPPPPVAPDWPTPDNGTDIPDAEMQPIHDHYRGLPDHVRALVARWADQGRDTNRHWGRHHRGDPWTQRATALTLAAIACATHLWDDDEPDLLTRTAIGVVTGQPLEEAWLTGAVFGALTVDQAAALEDLATRYGNGEQQALTAIGEAITRT